MRGPIRLVTALAGLLALVAVPWCWSNGAQVWAVAVGDDGLALLSFAWRLAAVACGVLAVACLALAATPPPRPVDEAAMEGRRRTGVRIIALGILLPILAGGASTLVAFAAQASPTLVFLVSVAAMPFVAVGMGLIVVGMIGLARARTSPWRADPEVDQAIAEMEQPYEGPTVLLEPVHSALPWENR